MITGAEIQCQECVKKVDESPKPTSDIFSVKITPEMLVSLRRELQMSLTEFGTELARAINPQHAPFTRQYISRLEHGKDRITPELVSAFYNIAAVLDEVPAGIGGAVSVTCLAQPGQHIDGAFIPRSAEVCKCARPGCAVRFVRTHPRQKYHDPECRR
jgi:transcriptional regulator with XRE-family HTH domain